MTDENPSNSPPGEPPLAAGPEKTAGGYQVVLPTFEGPLDLLLHLIEQHELDIRDIPIAFVAAKFVEYITLMEELNIDVASEYAVKTFAERPRQDLFEDRALLREGVAIALAPLFAD